MYDPTKLESRNVDIDNPETVSDLQTLLHIIVSDEPAPAQRNHRRKARKARGRVTRDRQAPRVTKKYKAHALAVSWARRLTTYTDEPLREVWYACQKSITGKGYSYIERKPHTLFHWARQRVRGRVPRIFRFVLSKAKAIQRSAKRSRETKRAALAAIAAEYNAAKCIPTYTSRENIRLRARRDSDTQAAYAAQVLESKVLGSETSKPESRVWVPENPHRESCPIIGRRGKAILRGGPDCREPNYDCSTVQTLRCADGIVRTLGTLREVWTIYFAAMNRAGYETTTVQRCADGIVRKLGQYTENWIAYFGDSLE